MERIVVIDKESACEQVKKILEHYPNLHIYEENDNHVHLVGSIRVYRCFDDFIVNKEYPLEIEVPLGCEKLPYVIDSERMIDKSFEHINTGHRLCLETDVTIYHRFFKQGFDLLTWMDEYVEPYYVSYEYFMTYGEFPYGSRRHGIEGVVDSYAEILKTDDSVQTYRLIKHIANNRYRGHTRCPCGSEKRFRRCHGQTALLFYNSEILLHTLKKDFKLMEELGRAYNETSCL